jgi:hypothetical protein
MNGIGSKSRGNGFLQLYGASVVAENSGDTTSHYFYQRPASYESDEVAVRRALLRGLREQGLITVATLEGFRDAGFLFDHAIRCQLPPRS